ncbi:hypothetical protein NUKP82_24790 [Klebsiella variicola]|nr:hypothetical protein KLVA_07890 [Klebsiella variicola]GKN21625.1 hypothetical protein NUKP82_24790 [Klebsiella variicola]GKN41303.1 hypothetical protein NUKP84_20970 [Klebsiella variicola]SLO99773.1 Uncharacterised protein [Klebsiella variicola]
MNSRKTVLKPPHIDPSFMQIQIVIVQIQQFADAHAVAKGKQDEAVIPFTGWALASGLHHCLNFFGGKKTTSVHNISS